MLLLRRFLIVFLTLLISWVGLAALKRHLDPNKSKSEEEREDAKWIATSRYFLDRFACRYFALCGLAHFRPDPAVRRWNKKTKKSFIDDGDDGSDDAEEMVEEWEDILSHRHLGPDELSSMGQIVKDVPQFVLDAAPLVHLYSGEQFWPSSMDEHLAHTIPSVNHTALDVNDTEFTIANLADLHNFNDRARTIFLRSKDDVEDRPYWLGSPYNIPLPYDDSKGGNRVEEDDDEAQDPLSLYRHEIRPDPERSSWWEMTSPASNPLSDATSEAQSRIKVDLRRREHRHPPSQKPIAGPDSGGYSDAPAILILVDKGHGVLDAFWFYFYSYNLGVTVFNMRFGNHVGDWEHSLIRFYNGKPKAVFFSAHSGGTAYTWDAVEKGKGGRPVLYSARGSHAMYAMPGKHPYVLPGGILADVTDKGPLWDPTKNYLATPTRLPSHMTLMLSRSVPSPTCHHYLQMSPSRFRMISSLLRWLTSSSLSPPIPRRQPRGSGSRATGATSSTSSVTCASGASLDSITMSTDPWDPSTRTLAEARSASPVVSAN